MSVKSFIKESKNFSIRIRKVYWVITVRIFRLMVLTFKYRCVRKQSFTSIVVISIFDFWPSQIRFTDSYQRTYLIPRNRCVISLISHYPFCVKKENSYVWCCTKVDFFVRFSGVARRITLFSLRLPEFNELRLMYSTDLFFLNICLSSIHREIPTSISSLIDVCPYSADKPNHLYKIVT